jgi:hypothetical protein
MKSNYIENNFDTFDFRDYISQEKFDSWKTKIEEYHDDILNNVKVLWIQGSTSIDKTTLIGLLKNAPYPLTNVEIRKSLSPITRTELYIDLQIERDFQKDTLIEMLKYLQNPMKWEGDIKLDHTHLWMSDVGPKGKELQKMEDDIKKLSEDVVKRYHGKNFVMETDAWNTHCYSSKLNGHRDAASLERLCAVLLYFSPYPTIGGNLVVGNGDKKTTIPPTFGKGVIINLGFEKESDSPYHEVTPTIEGQRISLTTFYNR